MEYMDYTIIAITYSMPSWKGGVFIKNLGYFHILVFYRLFIKKKKTFSPVIETFVKVIETFVKVWENSNYM